MKCNHKKIKSIPKEMSLHDNRCFNGYCENCTTLTVYCEHKSKYICCDCCESGDKEN